MDLLNYKKPGAAAAITYFWPGLGHLYIRNYKRGFIWMIFSFIVLLIFSILWKILDFRWALIFIYLIYLIFMPLACKSAFRYAIEFNKLQNTNSSDILEDPSTAFMMSMFHPGLGHLYIGAIETAKVVLRITVTSYFIPLFFLALKMYPFAIVTGILWFLYHLIGSFLIGKNAFAKAKELNLR